MKKLLLAGTVVLLFVAPGAAQMNTQRFKELTPETMTADQKRVAEGIVSGPRKGMRGPFNALLRSPEMGDLAQQFGAAVRFHSSVPRKLNELAIIVTARFWTSQFEWQAHHRAALEAGLVVWPNVGQADGINGDLAMLAPPFIVSHDEIDLIVHRFGEALRATVVALPLPEVRYFLETFAPSVRLTLDELG